MTDNDLKTRPVPHQPASGPAADPGGASDVGDSPFAGATPPPASYQVVGEGTATADVPAKRTVLERIRNPVVAAVGGGILILGAGFGAGFAVGHGTGGGDQSAVQGGPDGQGIGGQGLGAGPGGQSGQNGTGQNGTGVPDMTGQGQTGADGSTDGTTTGSADSAITT